MLSRKKIITLAGVWCKRRAELRADFQQYYGIDIERAMQGEHSVTHIAELLPQLPSNARVFVAEDNDRIWTFADTLTATLVNSLNGLIWGFGDPRKRGARPEPIGPRALTKKGKKSLPARAMPVSELIETLSKPRR